MTAKHDKRLADLERRISNGAVIGTISQVDHEKGRYRVKSGELESDWIPKTETRAGKTKVYSSYEEGEQVIVLSPSGDLSQGVIVGAVATQETQAADKGNIHRTVYPDGTVVEYDHEAKALKTTIAEGGSFNIAIGGGVSISASGGELTINAPGGIALESATLTHNGKNVGHDHKHTDVVPGPALTGPPAG
ncbi:phage baseplate assembly protein V [Ensifer sp. LCM 4579]|uniref:phage baseplate assembly protein V n=1 Tax=Ensifer sp. LCM 4579 TaxID=1848292 RepID=UPI0008D98F5A|nr:phage baseplate assembly protein V [Ensifer sp. LCM 4579]OHV85803.1 hypothetical protein LCM4579_00075 [Ensifer sp. LCM 4579]